MSATRVKICGMTRLEDARLAVDLGASAIGFVFWPRSPRVIALEQARVIASSLPALVARVGVFVDERVDTIRQIAETVGLDVVQLHGNERAEDYSALPARLIK